MTPGFGPSGSINLSSLPGSVSSGDPTGLQPLTVQSVQSGSGGHRVTARLGSSTVNFTSGQAPPEGSVLVGRIRNAGNGYELDVLTTPQELEQVKTKTLMDLLSRSGLNPSEGDASRLFSRLGRQGYLTASDVSGEAKASKTTSLTGQSLTVAEGSRSVVQGMADGSVVEGTVLEAGEQTARLLVDGREVSVQSSRNLREGSVLKLQVQNSGTTPSFQVQSVSTPSPDADTLTALRNALGIDSSDETLSRLENVLTKNSDRPAGEVLNRITREFSSAPANPSSDTAKSARELIEQYRQSQDDSTLRKLRDMLGLRGEDEATRRLKAVMLDSRGSEPSTVVERLRSEFSSVRAETVNSNRERILRLVENFQSSLKSGGEGDSAVSNLKNLGSDQVARLLREMGFEPDKETVRTARKILATDPSPDKQTLRTVLENVGMARGDDGNLNTNRLKTMLFLAKNELPMKEDLVKLLQHAAPGDGAATRELSSQFLGALGQVDTGSLDDRTAALADAARAAEFNPSGSQSAGSASEQLMDALKTMGFDLENQVARNAGSAGETLRSRLMAVQQVLADSATSVLQQAVSTGDANLRDQSRTLLSQLMKHSLASVADDDSIFLFVPFPDGEGTGLMRLKFEDEGDSDTVTDEEWTVTINLDLSELGGLQVQARRHREKLNLTFKASEKGTLTLIDEHQDRLVGNLSEKGFEVSVRTRPWNDEEGSLLDWDLYFDTNDFNATFDVTV